MWIATVCVVALPLSHLPAPSISIESSCAVFVKGSTKDVPERECVIAEIARTIYDYYLPIGSFTH